MEKSLFEQMGGTYTRAGDYLLPSLTLSEEEQKPIGIWGQRHARHLKMCIRDSSISCNSRSSSFPHCR